jgi:glycosyltransferase involved in cell wall biosynthesis
VVTPSFNQGHFLEETIRSVLLQGYPNLEYIVIDGGSTDNSLDVIRHYEAHLAYWISESDRGQPEAINKGFVQSTGGIMAWLNSDDLYLPGALFEVAQQIVSHPENYWLVGRICMTDAEGETILMKEHNIFSGKRVFANGLKWAHPISQPSVFWTRDFWQKLGPLDESLRYAMDWKLWLTAFAQGCQPLWTGRELATYRLHPESKTVSEAIQMRLEAAGLLWKLGWMSGFCIAPLLDVIRILLRDSWLLLADRWVSDRKPMRATLYVILAMIASPRIIRRRLYTFRQIAHIIFDRAQSS